MSEQRHVIKRQVIELKIQGDAQPQPLQDELSRVYRQRILPMIDRYCSSLSGPDQIYRIDRLDLDLGELDPYGLEEDFVAKVDAALSRELDPLIRNQEQAARRAGASPRAQSQLELFAFFVSTGCLPWWADAARPGLLAENLEGLLNEAPEALSRQLQTLLHEPEARRRLANQYSDDQLTALSSLLVPSCAAALQRDFHDLLAGLRHIRADSSGDAIQLRQILWGNILLAAGSQEQMQATPEAFYRAVLKRVGMDLGISTLLTDLQQAEMPFNRELAEIVARLTGPGPNPSDEAPISRLARLQARGGSLAPTWAGLIGLLRELPEDRRSALETAIDEFLSGASAQTTSQRILQILQTGSRENTSPKFEAVLRQFRAAPGGSSPESGNAKPKTIDLSFSQAGEYPVSNAGLVILWPFLGHFFAHLGLLDEDRHFKDLASRHRAAGLLQVVATQAAPLPEYLLPLNKLLCGLGLEDVFEFGPELLESETQECDNLLAAVISQAPILRDMSPDGFRGSFLLRAGVLSARDGMGLLRVERQTYDIVLERFPWSWEWVRLSWMEAPLRVEW